MGEMLKGKTRPISSSGYRAYLINQHKFGTGSNSFMAGTKGAIFVTELGSEASAGALNQIGVFGERQQFIIQLSEENAFVSNEQRISGGFSPSGRSIYSMPGNVTLDGNFTLLRRF